MDVFTITLIVTFVLILFSVLSFCVLCCKGRKNAKARRRNQNNLRPPNSISPPPDRNRQQALDIYLIHDDRGNVVGIVSPSNGEPGRNGVILPGSNSELPRPMDWPPPYAEESPDMPPPTYEESNSNPV